MGLSTQVESLMPPTSRSRPASHARPAQREDGVLPLPLSSSSFHAPASAAVRLVCMHMSSDDSFVISHTIARLQLDCRDRRLHSSSSSAPKSLTRTTSSSLELALAEHYACTCTQTRCKAPQNLAEGMKSRVRFVYKERKRDWSRQRDCWHYALLLCVCVFFLAVVGSCVSSSIFFQLHF